MDNTNYLIDWEDVECDDHPVLASFSNSNISTKNDDWRTINNEIALGATLRDSKYRKTQAQEYKVIDVYFNPHEKKNRNKKRRRSSYQINLNTSKSKFSKYSKIRCPLRIEELALPSKRLCYDTFKYKSHILPAIMVQRLIEQIMDQRPKVKVSEAVEYFKRKRKIKNRTAKTCKKVVIVDKVKDEDWNLNLLVGVLAYKIICKLMKPLNLFLSPELQKLSYVVNWEIKEALKDQRKKKYLVRKNYKLQDEISKTITMWIIEILHDADYKLKLDDLQDLERTYGHIFDIVDEVVESTLIICLPSTSEKSETSNSEEFGEENETNEIEQNESGKISSSSDDVESECNQEHINAEINDKIMKQSNYKHSQSSLENAKSETKNERSDENYEEEQKIVPLDENMKSDDELTKTVHKSNTELQQSNAKNNTVESLEILKQEKNKEECNEVKEKTSADALKKFERKKKSSEELNTIVNTLHAHSSEIEKNNDVETTKNLNQGQSNDELKETKEITSSESFKSIKEENNIITREEFNKIVDIPNTTSLQPSEIERKNVAESLDNQGNVNEKGHLSSEGNLEKEASPKSIDLQHSIGSYNFDSHNESETKIFTENTNTTEANNDVSDKFYIRDQSLNSGSRNVTFRNRKDLGDEDELSDGKSSIGSEKKWFQQLLASDQKLHEKSSNYNIIVKNLAPPNYNLLESVDEKWPLDIPSSRENLVNSISRSIMSLGKLKEDEELQYYKNKPKILDNVSVEKILPIEVDVENKAIEDDYKNTEMKDVVFELKIKVTDFEKIRNKNLDEQTNIDQMGNYKENKTYEKSGQIDQQNICEKKLNIKSTSAEEMKILAQAPTKNKILAQAPTKKIILAQAPTKKKNLAQAPTKKKILGQDLTNKNDFDKTTSVCEFEYKLDLQTAPSWVLKLIDRRKFKQEHLSKWCNNLEENLDKMSEWNNWLVNTCDSILSLKQSNCIRPQEKLRLWDVLSHDMGKTIATWSKYFQIQKENMNEIKNKRAKLNGKPCNCKRSKKL